jgi:hypothetical protein
VWWKIETKPSAMKDITTTRCDGGPNHNQVQGRTWPQPSVSKDKTTTKCDGGLNHNRMQIRTQPQLGVMEDPRPCALEDWTTTRSKCEEQYNANEVWAMIEHNQVQAMIELQPSASNDRTHQQTITLWGRGRLLCYEKGKHWMNWVLPRGRWIVLLVQRWECQT